MTVAVEQPDLAIVGAGPAGLGAAIAAREAGLSVMVLDDQVEPGGQIWRGAGSANAAHVERLGAEYKTGRENVLRFLASGADYRPRHILWHIETEGDDITLHCAGPEGSLVVQPRSLLLATGAVERPVPIPGWTLPGVMTAGGLQILLKSSQMASDKAVLAGAGPLLWLIAAQMIKMGVPPLAVVECVPLSSYLAAAGLLPSTLRQSAPLRKGLSLMADVRRSKVPVYRGAKDLAVEGDTRVRALRFKDWSGRRHRIEAEVVGLHAGVTPNQQAGRVIRLPYRWSKGQHAFCPVRDDTLKVADNIYFAGDGARIGGADVAWLEGQMVGRLIGGRNVADLQQQIAAALTTRPFIDRLYLPPAPLRQPDDATVVCRCEGVTAGRIRQAVRDGAMGPNQVKFMLRPGMGPCQGRVCGLAVSEIVATTLGQDLDAAGYFRIRPPLKPISLGIFAPRSGSSK